MRWCKYLKTSIWPVHGTLTVITILHQNGPENNDNEEFFYIALTSRLKLNHQMQFRVIPSKLKILFFSSTFKSWVFVCHKGNLKNTVRTWYSYSGLTSAANWLYEWCRWSNYFGYHDMNCSATRIPSSSIMGCNTWPIGNLIKEDMLLLCRGTISRFYCPSWQSRQRMDIISNIYW